MNLLIYILRIYINRTHNKFILLKVVVLSAFTLKLSKAKKVLKFLASELQWTAMYNSPLYLKSYKYNNILILL